jgi:hypothetical protein
MQPMPTIHEVKARHEGELLALEGVVSVGIGRDASGQAVIVVGVESSAPEIQSRLPRQLEGYSVAVEPTGGVRAQ